MFNIYLLLLSRITIVLSLFVHSNNHISPLVMEIFRETDHIS